MIRKEAADDGSTVRVTFSLPPLIWAETAHLVGEFNTWNPASHPLRWDRQNEVWSITLELPKGREYRFRYLVNGTEWHNDWDADRYEPNPYGGDNSVVAL